MKKYFPNFFLFISFFCFANIIEIELLHAQPGVQGTQSKKIKWLSTGSLRSWFDNFGAEGEFFRRDRNTYVSQDQIDGLCWPNEYNARMKGIQCGKGLWIGTTNFNDPVTNITYPYKVIGSGFAAVYTGTEIIADESFGDDGISMIGKFNHPPVFVDNTVASSRNQDDEIDQVDPSILSDRIIINKFHTSIGITVTRKIIASSQQYNDNYFIYEYTFKNTGIIDESNQQKLNSTLTGVIFYFLSRYSFAGESYTGKGVGDWFPAGSSWGWNTLFDHVGQDANHQLASPNDFQAILAYYGPHTASFTGTPQGDIGLPGPRATNVWTLAGTQFAGVVVLHADKSPNDPANDKTKLITTQSVSADQTRDVSNYYNNQYDPTLMSRKYLEFMSAGHSAQTQAELIGKDENGWPDAFVNQPGTDPSGFLGTQGFGPYTLAPGESIRIVLAEAVAGISHEKIYEVAENWFENNTSQFVLPKGYKGGTITSDRNEYKNAWVFSGKDSLFQTFRRAIANYNNNYSIPIAPPPPENFTIHSGTDRIKLSWSNNAGSWPNFNGYRVFRAASKPDTMFEKIFECDKNNLVNSFDDVTAENGFGYYYYIQTKDDGSTNPGNTDLNIPAGEPLVSSKYYTITSKPAALLPASVGNFCTHQSGEWNDVNSWEQYNGSAWEYPAAHVPGFSDNSITILNGHIISFSASDTVDQLKILAGGELLINESAVLHINNGNDTDLVVNGSLKNFGQISKEDSALIIVGENGYYNHEQDGGMIPIAVWEPGSTCKFDSIKTFVPVNIKQNFSNVVWDCPKQTSEINLGWNGGTIFSPILGYIDEVFIRGNVNIKNTGSGVLLLCSPHPDSLARVTIYGDFIQSGGHFSVSNSDDPATEIIVSNTGNFNLSGGEFSLSSGSQGNSGTVWNFLGSDVSISNSTIQNLNPGSAKFVFSYGLNSITLGKNNNIISLPIEVVGTLRIGTQVLKYSGSFILQPGATLEITNPQGLDSTIQVSGMVSFSKGANYNFCGISAQVTGNSLPDTVNSLIINNEDGVTLSNSVDVTGTVEIKKGNILLDGNLLAYGANGTLKYSGLIEQITSNTEFPMVNGPKNLTVTNPTRTILHDSRIIPGILNCSGKLILGNYNLAADSILTQAYVANQYIETNGIGVLKLTSPSWQRLFPVGTQNAYAPVWIANAGSEDTVAVSVKDDNTKAVGGARVQVKWKISKSTGTEGNYTLKFGWIPSIEDSLFKTDRTTYAKIFRLLDTIEVGSGKYRRAFGSNLNTIQRGGITLLDTFIVGYFTGLTEIEKYDLGIPAEFKLSQNYPNPFNPVTKIRYEIPAESKVLIKIYDVLGREAATLVNDYQKAGRYQVEWRAGNFASGVYFYTIKAGDFSAVKKLILLK